MLIKKNDDNFQEQKAQGIIEEVSDAGKIGEYFIPTSSPGLLLKARSPGNEVVLLPSSPIIYYIIIYYIFEMIRLIRNFALYLTPLVCVLSVCKSAMLFLLS